MNRNINTLTETDTPSAWAAALAKQVAALKTAGEKRKLGQYFTPPVLAQLSISSLLPVLDELDGKIRILDPGTGTAVLSCVLIEELCKNDRIREIELTCYECDPQTAEFTAKSLEYLKSWANKKDVLLHYTLNRSDFVYEYSFFVETYPHGTDIISDKFDLIISNPPFFKLDSRSPYFSNTNYEFRYHLNIYHLFLFISANLLAADGRMIFIIPSSFFSGGYLAELRQTVLATVELERVHFIKSSGGIFDTGSVLSHTVIVIFRNRIGKIKIRRTEVTSLSGFPEGPAFHYAFSTDKCNSIFPLFTCSWEKRLFERLHSWPSTLSEAGYIVSEGNLLASETEHKPSGGYTGLSRKASFIFKDKNLGPDKDSTGKLIYKRKIIDIPEDQYSFLPQCNLVIIRRYNTKHSVPVKCSPFLISAQRAMSLIIDKRLLYLYKPGCEMSAAETVGLSVYLNSNLLRKYIDITYGKINLTRQEYLNLPCPPADLIIRTGQYLLKHFSAAEHPESK